MSYSIKQAPIGGRLGSGIGQGLAEQIPKEIDRSRLSAGLSQFSDQSSGLNPMQQMAKLASIPGITPQMIQTFGELARQQAKAGSLNQRAGQQSGTQQPRPFPRAAPSQQPGSNVPSITKEQPLADVIQGYIPPTQDQIYDDASKMYNENPGLFGNDPQKAIEAANEKALREEKRYEAQKGFHQTLSNIQDNVVKRLKDQSQNLNVQIPANTYSKIEDEAIQATKPKSEGGRGLTEQQSMKEYGDKLDGISREYAALDAIGDWSITGRKPKDVLTTLQSTREKFRKRDDLDNFAEMLIAKNGFSPLFAYSQAKPIKEVQDINSEISKLPYLGGQIQSAPGMFGAGFKAKDVVHVKDKTLEISQKLAPLIKSGKASPYSVAYELEKKGYDPSIWLDYVRENQDDLDLTKSQLKEFDKPLSLLGRLNDWWLNSWSGMSKEK